MSELLEARLRERAIERLIAEERMRRSMPELSPRERQTMRQQPFRRLPLSGIADANGDRPTRSIRSAVRATGSWLARELDEITELLIG